MSEVLARQQQVYADEIRNREEEEYIHLGHECAHQWTITVSSVGHSYVEGEPDSHKDSDWSYTYQPVTVRAHSLATALRTAAELPLVSWFGEDDEP